MEKVTLDVGTGCWNWTAHVDQKGYGQAWFQGRMLWAYRLIYAMFRGPIRGGMTLDHKCRNPTCCNPWHLTQKTLGRNSAEANRRRGGVPF